MKNLNLFTLLALFLINISCSEKEEPINDEEKALEIVRDIDGNEYDVVLVNGRKWLLQDLRTRRYRDGTPIPRVEDTEEWSQLNEGAYTWYDNDPANDEIYGKIYNGYAITCCEICPEGWRLPTNIEVQSIRNFVRDRELGPNIVVEWKIIDWLTIDGFVSGERLSTGEFENEKITCCGGDDGTAEYIYNWSLKYAQPNNIGENPFVFKIETLTTNNFTHTRSFHEVGIRSALKAGAYVKCIQDN